MLDYIASKQQEQTKKCVANSSKGWKSRLRCKQIGVWWRLASCLLVSSSSWGQSDSRAQDCGGVGFEETQREVGLQCSWVETTNERPSKAQHRGKPRDETLQQNHWPPEPRTGLPTLPDAILQMVLLELSIQAHISAPSAAVSTHERSALSLAVLPPWDCLSRLI